MDFIMGDGSKADSLLKQDKKTFKAEGGRTYRASVANFPLDEHGVPDLTAVGPKMVGGLRVFIDNVGYVLVDPKHKDAMERISKKTINPYAVFVLVIWPTNKDGQLSQTRLQDGEVEVYAWVVSKDKYTQLASQHEEWHFGKHDLKIVCTATEFQKMTFLPFGENILAKVLAKESDLRTNILESVQREMGDMRKYLGRDMTPEQVMAQLSGKTSPDSSSDSGHTVSDVVNNEEIDDILNSTDFS